MATSKTAKRNFTKIGARVQWVGKTAKRKFIKIGARVQWVGNRGTPREGRVAGTDVKANGPWVAVNCAPKGKNPDITRVQQSRLTVVG
jgi:hypothetical protein